MLNMVLGTGPMSLPYAFNQAGFLLSSVFLALMMGFSYITCTFVIECLGTADRLRRKSASADPNDAVSFSLGLISGRQESPEGSEPREIYERMEIGALGQYLIPGALGKLAYVVVIIYAYGVLTVYVIAACVSLSTEVGDIGGVDSYRPIVVGFVLLVSPICLLDFRKTRPLQVVVGILRILAIVFMMVVMVRYIMTTKEESVPLMDRIPWWNWSGLPSIFGNAAFSFMIHHSLPGLVFPMYKQESAAKVVRSVYLSSYCIYLLQCFLALWAFGDVTLKKCGNTPSDPCEIQGLFNTNFASADYVWAAKFIVLYPVGVVSVFPLVAITLRNNLKAVFGVSSSIGLDGKHVGFTMLTVGPPYIAALITKDVQLVLKYVGCYFGLSLMLLTPTIMVVHSRKAAKDAGLGRSALRSPFGRKGGVKTVLAFFAGAIIFSTVNFVLWH